MNLIDLNPDECEELLQAGHYGHLGCGAEGDIYVLPITYIYRDKSLYSHTSEGQKINIMRKNPRVCVQFEKVRTGNDWESVICWGRFEEVTDPEQIKEIHLALAQQYGRIAMEGGNQSIVSPLITDLGQVDKTKPADVIYRIAIEHMTGKAQRPHSAK